MSIQPYILCIIPAFYNMPIKQKLINAIGANSKLTTFAIGLAITMAVGTAIGMLDHQHLAFAISQSQDSEQNSCFC